MANIYARDVSRIKTLDPYRLQELYKMHPCAEHVVKKMLVAGEREGEKDLDVDISDCIRTLQRWQAMRLEDKAALTPVSGGTIYEWLSAPEWAVCAATDEDGSAYFYGDIPSLDGPDWDCPIGVMTKSIPGNPATNLDYRLSLEARP